MSTFPAELIENILEHTYGEYKPLEKPVILHQCAQVCRTWRTIAQSLIFSELLLSIGNPQIKILQENDSPRQLVRRVWVRYPGSPEIQGVLNLLPNLQEIHIIGPNTSLPNLSTSFAQGVMSNITSLSLSGVSFSVNLLSRCTSLQDLKINCCMFDLTDNDPLPSSSRQLRSLYIRANRIVEMEIIPWMLGPRSAFDLTRLTTLRTSDRTNHLEGYALVQELVEQCASTVQDLMVDPPTMYAVLNPDLSPECVLNPTKLSSLRTIRIAIIQEMEDYTNFIPWLIALFSSFAVNSKLEEILIPCVFPEHSLDVETGAKEDTIGEYGWEALDDLLSTSIQTLKRVVISVYGNYGVNPQGDHSLGIQFRTAFPRLTERGMLEIMGSLEPGCVSSEDCWWRLVDKANS